MLGEPDSAWVGAARIRGRRPLRPRRPRRPRQRHLLLPTLHAVQARVGWISPGALAYVCRRLTIPPAEAYGVASFYALFATRAAARRSSRTCAPTSPACAAAPDELVAELERTVGPAGQHLRERPLDLAREPVPGPVRARAGRAGDAGGRGPGRAARSRRRARPTWPRRWPGQAARADGARPGRRSTGSDGVRLLRRFGIVDPTSLDSYRAHGGYEALRRAFALGQAGVIREVSESKLLGRGGAAFPTGRKWDAVARQPIRPHYLVCNADESEPGTFKDRIVFEQDPFSVIEAMTIAGLRDRLRARLPVPARRVPAGVGAARERGHAGAPARLPGRRHHGPGRCASTSSCARARAPTSAARRLRSSTRSRASAASRATSRRSRSMPACSGKPTVVNNVETLVNVLDIVLAGGAPVRRDRHRGLDRHAALLPVRLRAAGRASTRRRSA